MLIEYFLGRGDQRTLGTVAIRLVLTADDRHRPAVVLHQYHLRVVLCQIYGIEVLLHLLIELAGFLRGLQVSQQHTFQYQVFFLQVVEATEEGIRR